MDNLINKLALYLSSSSVTTVLTGAGMSVESGIPDFRSKSGWWRKIDPRTVATIEALETNYDLFHEFYCARIRGFQECYPHKGHHLLAEWEQTGLIQAIATQNVDGFHLVAGSKNVSELHGSIRNFRCNGCGSPANKADFLSKHTCVNCGGKLRPNIVLFGEMLPEQAWDTTLRNIQMSDLVIIIGTSLEVYPVNELPSMTNGKTVLINKDLLDSYHQFDLIIQGNAKEVLEKTDEIMRAK